MWIHPKPVFNTTTTAAALVARATSDISSSSSSSSSTSSSSHHPECPPAYPSCDPEGGGGPGPALLPVANADSSAGASADNFAGTGTGTGTLVTPTPQAALATSIQHFGKQNFVGLLVLGLFALAGLVLWLTFGAWPRRMMRRLRARGDVDIMGTDGESTARRGADLDRDAASQGEGAHAHAREPSESEETKVQPASEEGAPGSPQSLEMEVEGLEKGTGEAASEAKGRTLPRVRFA